MFTWLKKIWTDPVWSKVIATAIAGSAVWAFAHWYEAIRQGWQDHPVAHQWVVFCAVVLLFASGIVILGRKTKLEPEIEIIVDSIANAPSILLTVHNRSWKQVRIAAVEFKTLNHWDIPNLNWMGSSRPTVQFLGPHVRRVEISPDKDSTAKMNIGEWVRRRTSKDFEFRLTTRHSPAEGFGLFPFHLEVELIYGPSDSRMRLKDVVASLNGRLPTSGVECAGPINVLMGEPGELRNNAHQALRVIEEGACANPKTADVLRAFARQ